MKESFKTKFWNFKENISDFLYFQRGNIVAIGVLSFFALEALGAGHHIAYGVHRTHDVARNKVLIEKNVAESAGLAKFTGRALTVSKSETKHFVEMFGVGIEKPGAEPEFMSVSYNVNKDLYEKLFKYVDIEYVYGPDGKLVNADYKLRKKFGSFWWGKSR